MNAAQKVAVVTGASRGIGAALVPAYRKLGCAVVANSRSGTESGDPEVSTVRGDVAEPGVGGHIVNISTSLVDHVSSQSPSALASLTKGGLNAVTKALAIEHAPRGIRVNTVALGVIRTAMHPASSYGDLATLKPVGRLGEIDDAIMYLENAAFVTGEILHVDGGQSAGTDPPE